MRACGRHARVVHTSSAAAHRGAPRRPAADETQPFDRTRESALPTRTANTWPSRRFPGRQARAAGRHRQSRRRDRPRRPQSDLRQPDRRDGEAAAAGLLRPAACAWPTSTQWWRDTSPAAERGRTGERYILGGENLTYRQLLLSFRKSSDAAPRPGTSPPGSAAGRGALDVVNRFVPRPIASGDQLRLSAHNAFFDSGKAVRRARISHPAVS